jgi:hypothetical protein
MKLDLYCVGVCHDDGEPTQIAGCGMVIIFTDDYGRIRARSFGYGLGNSNQNLADLQAARLALASVKPAFRGGISVLHTTNQYVVKMLDRNLSPVLRRNDREIQETRRWYSYYNNITTVLEDHNNSNITQARDLAEIGLTTQERSDSGTLEGLDIAS